MEDYYKDYGRFPPAYILGDDGTPAHSWRILLLEYLEPELFAQYRFDQPWNSPENKKLESKMPRFYACPADSTALNKWQTNYFVVVGPGTPFPGMKSSNLEDMKTKDSTILLVESTGQGIHWMEPRDLTLENFGLGDQSGNNIPVENAHYETMRAFAVGGGMLFLDRSSKLHIRNMLLSDNDDQ